METKLGSQHATCMPFPHSGFLCSKAINIPRLSNYLLQGNYIKRQLIVLSHQAIKFMILFTIFPSFIVLNNSPALGTGTVVLVACHQAAFLSLALSFSTKEMPFLTSDEYHGEQLRVSAGCFREHRKIH